MVTRLVDYVVVVSHDHEKERNGASVGRIVQRFPEEEWPDSAFFPGLELFCQPCGWRLHGEAGRPTFWTSVLTDVNAEPHYAAVLSFRLPAEEEGEEAEGGEGGASRFASTSLVLVSQHYIPDTLKDCLAVLFTVYAGGSGPELEGLVGTLLGGLVCPPPGAPLHKFSLGAGDRQALQPPLSASIPPTRGIVADLFARLGLYNVLTLFSAVLTDKKILFHSRSINRVTEACQALTALLYPLSFSNVYVPILPGALLEYLGAPSPYIMGIHSEFKQCLLELFDVITVDLDTGAVMVPEGVDVPPLPEPFAANLQTALNLVRDPALFQDDLCFPSAAGLRPHNAPPMDLGIRACFVRLFAQLLSGYRPCLQLVRLLPKPSIAFHRSAFLGLRHFQEDEFMKLLLESNSFATFVQKRGLPFRLCDLFDEEVAGVGAKLAEESGSPAKQAQHIAALAHQLALNEAPNNSTPFVANVPQPSEASLAVPPSRPFPLLDAAKVREELGAQTERRRQRAETSPPLEELAAPRQVPDPDAATHASFAGRGGPNQRRLEVLRTCLHHLMENRVAESRKMISAVVLSLKSGPVRVALCQELQTNLREQRNRATLEPAQFELLARLCNAALEKETELDEFGVAYALMGLSAVYCRKLSQGVHQFLYTALQEHAVWKTSAFWEAAFFHDVHAQLRALYQPSKAAAEEERALVGAFPFGKGLADVWDLGRRPTALQLAGETLRLKARLPSSRLEDYRAEEESIVFSQAIHYTNLLVYLRVPLDASRLRRVNMENLEARSVAGSHRSATERSLEEDSLSMDGGSSLSQGESGFIETQTIDTYGDGNSSSNDLGAGTVRTIAKFLDKVCSEARLPAAQLSQLLQRIPGFVGAHIENLEQVHRESKRLPPIARPKMLMPAFLPGEEMLQGYLRVYLLPDGRSGLGGTVEMGAGDWGLSSALLPAEGALFLTNYRLIFKGQPSDPSMCESVIVRSIPVMGLTKLKRVGSSSLGLGMGENGPSLHDALQIRSSTFQLLKVAFDAEVNSEKVETFCNSLEGVRWPDSVTDLFALKGNAGMTASQPTPSLPSKRHGALNKISKMTKKLRSAGSSSSQSQWSGALGGRPAELGPERHSSLRPPRPPPPGRGVSAPTQGHSLSRSGSQSAESEDGDTLREERAKTLTQTLSRALPLGVELGERGYLRDLARLGLLGGPGGGWRASRANEAFQLCGSYPAVVVVPEGVGDEGLRKVAKGFRHSRLPLPVWRSDAGALLLRAAGFNPRSRFRDAFSGSGTGAAEEGGLVRSSMEQERFLAALVALSPAHSVPVGGLGRGRELTSSLGSLLSLDSLLLAETQSLCSDSSAATSATPEVIRRPPSAGPRARGMRPGHQRPSSGVSSATLGTTISGTLRRHRPDSAHDLPTTLSRAPLYVLTEKAAAKSLKAEGSGLRCEVVPVHFPSSHDTKTALKKLMRAAAPSALAGPSAAPDMAHSFWRQVEGSGWLHTLSHLLKTATAIADLVDIQNSSVAICLEGGWDATAQLSSLAQVLLDPEYRTLEGLRILVEKEWLAMGHRFSHRLNHTQETSSSGVAPTFLLFLDALHQLLHQFPGAFEFNDFFLRYLAYHSTAAYYADFLLDCEAERVAAGLVGSLSERKKLQISGPLGSGLSSLSGLAGDAQRPRPGRSLWDLVFEHHGRSPVFNNFLYCPSANSGVLRPGSSVAALELWGYFQEDPLSTGSAYDLQSAAAEWRERGNEAAHEAALHTHALPNHDPAYHPSAALQDHLSALLDKLNTLEADASADPPRSWASLLSTATRQATLLRPQDPKKIRQPVLGSLNSEFEAIVSRAVHKKATIQMLLRGRMGGGGPGGPAGPGSGLSSGGSGPSPHAFVKNAVTAPVSCGVCDRIVWGMLKTSLRCRSCDLVSHKECVPVAPSNCTRANLNSSGGAGGPGGGPSLTIREDEEESAAVSTPSPRPELVAHEGYLYKRGALLKGWKPRWFVLDALKHQLRYYDSRDDPHCKGFVDLSEVASVAAVKVLGPGSPRPDLHAAFDLRTNKRLYNFAAASPREAAIWIEKIQACLQ